MYVKCKWESELTLDWHDNDMSLSSIHPPIHPSIVFRLVPLGVAGGAGADPSGHGANTGYTPDVSPVHRRAT